MTCNMPYKIEKKPMVYVVERERGAYSDWCHEFDVIAANSPDEAWFLIQKYWREQWDAAPPDKKKGIYFIYDGVCRAKWNDQKMQLDALTDVDWSGDYMDIWKCKIEPLSVIHFQSLE